MNAILSQSDCISVFRKISVVIAYQKNLPVIVSVMPGIQNENGGRVSIEYLELSVVFSGKLIRVKIPSPGR
jgi:hypothetical protein